MAKEGDEGRKKGRRVDGEGRTVAKEGDEGRKVMKEGRREVRW